jgi:hypothetical protein
MSVKRLMSVSTSVVLKRVDADFGREDYFKFPVNALVTVESEPGDPLVLTFVDLKAFSPLTSEVEKLEGLDLKRAMLAVKQEVEELIRKLSNPQVKREE